LSAILFGVAPAFLAGRSDIIEALKANQRQATSSRGQCRFREGLVAAEITLVFMLLAAAGLGIGALRDAFHVDRGWTAEDLLTAQLMVTNRQYAEPEHRQALLDQLEARILALPGVQGVGFSTSPMKMWSYGLDWNVTYLDVEGRKSDPVLVELEPVSARFFETMHLRLHRGRTFNANDRARADVLIINARMANRLFPNEDPIGKCLRNPPKGQWREIIGIVDDVRFPYRPVALPDSDLQAYRPEKGLPGAPVIVELRTAASPESLTAPLRRVVEEIDPDLPVFDVATGSDVIAQTMAPQSVPSMLLVVFAVLALLLAGVGIAGVISYSVAQRRGEIGIRMALGAQRGTVLRLILRQGARIIAIGTGLGLAGASLAVIVFTKLVPPLKDNASFALIGATAILIAVALAACYIPARRASKLDPLAVLREE
jgi:putative ABC transport system permease protein